MTKIAVLIPALNEEEVLPKLLAAIPKQVDQVVVADNGSTDRTAQIATVAGAAVVHEPQRGYGAACLAGVAWLEAHQPPDILVFLDGDFSDDPQDLPQLIEPILKGTHDFVLSDRTQNAEPGALSVPQRFGSWLAGGLIYLIWRQKFRDLGPFRAIRMSAYRKLSMADRNFGWTVEMQIKAAQKRIPTTEIPLPYYRRAAGTSKVSGNLKGSVLAGTKILYLIAASFIDEMRFLKKR